jgi:hypothetical protein
VTQTKWPPPNPGRFSICISSMGVPPPKVPIKRRLVRSVYHREEGWPRGRSSAIT